MHRTLLCTALLGLVGHVAALEMPRLPRQEGPRPVEQRETKGQDRGVVVKVETEQSRLTIESASGGHRIYVPHWRDGGFDREMSACIRALKPGDQVELIWEWEERYRVVKLRKAGEGKGPEMKPEKGEWAEKQKWDGEAHAKKSSHPLGECIEVPVPAQSEGSAYGVVKSVDPKGRLVLVDEGGCSTAYVPRWVGDGAGGSFDPGMVERIAALKPGQKVKVAWVWDERPRVVDLQAK